MSIQHIINQDDSNEVTLFQSEFMERFMQGDVEYVTCKQGILM